MERDILALMNKESHKFSKGQRLICKYISENYDKAAFMTAGKLGKTVGVSESTVVRFAAELGYDGYPGMRRAMQEMIRNRLTAVQRIEVAKEQIDRGNILDAVLSADMDKLRVTLDEVDKEDFNRAVDEILKAKTIYIVGMRSSTSLANFMGFISICCWITSAWSMIPRSAKCTSRCSGSMKGMCSSASAIRATPPGPLRPCSLPRAPEPLPSASQTARRLPLTESRISISMPKATWFLSWTLWWRP